MKVVASIVPQMKKRPLTRAISRLLVVAMAAPAAAFAEDLRLSLPQVTVTSSDGSVVMAEGQARLPVAEGDTVVGQIGVVMDGEVEVALAAQTCSVTFDLVVSKNRELYLGQGDGLDPISTDDYRLTGGSTTIPVTINESGAMTSTAQMFELTLLGDAEEETEESYGLYADNVTTTCNSFSEGGLYTVDNLFRDTNDGYASGGFLYGTLSNGPEVIVQEPGPEQEVPVVEQSAALRSAIYTTKAQLQTVTSISLQNARTRNQNIARELARRRNNEAGLNTDHLSLNIKGQGVSLGALGGAAGDSEQAWSGFISGSIEVGDAKDEVPGLDFDSNMITAGVDYRYDAWVFGAALTLASAESQRAQGAQTAEVDQQGVSAFISYFSQNFYLNFIASQSSNDYDFARQQNSAQVVAQTNGDELGFALGGGYEKNIKRWNLRAFFILDDTTVDVDGYAESASNLQMRVASFKRDEQNLDIGGFVNYTVNTQVGVFQPFAQLSYRDLLDGDKWSATAQYSGLEGSGTTELGFQLDATHYWSGQVGVSAVFPRGISAYLAYQQDISRSDWDIARYDVGLHWAF